ncbi:Mini-ribonuclease 3 [Halomicronema hongdechloris C2206]|uniref:Mini-ribonuclease 3 n=1 Tax=Halomicronema hongdechloris C2206 TaxID=1641165 RepID=A0A1Z3HNC0_9CYAN|nr:ribonuclease III domain-containing protein [Halomicronema hongdechloris]ASC71791.1 Mini-ribonuclease 3 [Halomicronema hongdechloris C2206]
MVLESSRFWTLRAHLTAEAMAMTRAELPSQGLSPTALAYLGDAVYELFVREQFLFPPSRIKTYHRRVVAQVRAEQQARHLTALRSQLTAAEDDIVRRGRNAAPKRPGRSDPQAYQQATGFEALIGYLYLNDPQRLLELLNHLDFTAPTP